MQDDSWSTVNTRSTFTSVSTYTEDMTARPLNNPMESQGLMGEGELQFNIGASDMGHMVSPPGYTEQRGVPEPRVETSEKEREENAGRSVTFADPMSTATYAREYPFTTSGATRRSYGQPRDEGEEMRRFFDALGHMSISDAAFALQPFAGSAHCGDLAEKWLEKFNMYCAFKKLGDEDRLRLFHLLMKDRAADWLRALPEHKKRDINSLTQEFILRHQLSCVEKWKQKAELWRRKQLPTESVDDYVATMQATARRLNMPEPYLADAIMQGLHPELRLHVLHSKAETVEEILEAARVSEVAHSANTTSASQMETLTAKVDLLLTNMVANKNEESTTAPKKVTFTQAVVAAETTNRSNRERPYSPAGRSPSRSPVRSSDGYQSSAGPLRREWSDNDRPFRRETDRRREMTQDRQRSTSWRPAFNGQRPAMQQQNGPFYNQQFQRQPRYNTALQQRLSGNCKFCGGSHQLGRQFCPAANVQCFNCSKIGHMAKVCRSRSAAQGYTPFNPQ
jgi:hypothetical protein